MVSDARACFEGVIAQGVTEPAYAVLCVIQMVYVSDDTVDDVFLLVRGLWMVHLSFHHSGAIHVRLCHGRCHSGQLRLDED